MASQSSLTATNSPRRQQLPEEVAAHIRTLIFSGAVRPGDYLRLERIAEEVGVSTTPVREGLRALESEGYVELVPRRGFVVAPFKQQDVRDLFWVQSQFAGELAARAAQNITPENLARLQENVDDYFRALAIGDGPTVVHLGHQFHREINLAADSPRLAALLGTVVKNLPNAFYATLEGSVESAGDFHAELLAALVVGDDKTVRSVMEQHILSGADRLIAMLEENGLWAPVETSA
ncbi:GntR family transcriptional regulator [Arthrobacter sp. FW306-2-2C-D06B]|nr:GntR family transcriptional regulator [Arthrobacter sp. FW306-2-2C-D06B]